MDRIYIIAEAGVNHNGDFALAKKMIEKAKKAGADAVKFQTFRTEKLVSAFAPKAEYQMQTTDCKESQMNMLKKLELSYNDFASLSRYAKEIGIDFLSTPFENDSIDFLNTLDMPYWKIPSGEITNKPYLIRLSKTRRPIILSTGMSTMNEISDALDIFADYSKSDIILLHCNTEYPTPYSDVNLLAMKTLGEAFGVRFGYSDHTRGIEIPVAAAALGASVIEKHFTLDHSMQGPDHKASLEPEQLSDMVSAIRNVECALGSSEKRPSASELKNITAIRKSIVAKSSIKKGETFTEDNITTKRPGTGITPMKWSEVLGLTAKRDFHMDENIEL